MNKKLNIFVIFFFIFFSTNLLSDPKIEKLKKLFQDGIITEEELKVAITKVKEQKNESKNSEVTIRKINVDPSGTKFEKLEFYLDNFRVYTIRPGAVYIDNVLTGSTDVILKDNFKFELTKTGKKYFEINQDKKNLKIELYYKGKLLINWTGKYVRRYQATFHQMQIYGYIPFHFFIKRPGKKVIPLNVEFFNKKIDKAVDKVKEELSIKYNLSLDDIDRILETQKEELNKEVGKEIDKIITKEQEKLFDELTDKYIGKEIDAAITQEIEKAIGEEMAAAFITYLEWASGQAIDDAVEKELADEINAAINEAIQQGVTAAAAAAAIEAMLAVYASGGTDAEALEACKKIAGDAC